MVLGYHMNGELLCVETVKCLWQACSGNLSKLIIQWQGSDGGKYSGPGTLI